MIVKELKEICKLVSMNGLIDEFVITPEKISGHEPSKTALAEIKHTIPISKNINISNVKGIIEILNGFPDDSPIEILENQLKISNGGKFTNILLKAEIDTIINIPKLKEFDIILKGIDHNILNKLGKMRPQVLIDERYYFYINSNNQLIMRIGNENETNIGDVVGIPEKFIPNARIEFTMNISECFKGIVTTANIYIILGQLMMIECNTEKYQVKYYLAPYAESS